MSRTPLLAVLVLLVFAVACESGAPGGAPGGTAPLATQELDRTLAHPPPIGASFLLYDEIVIFESPRAGAQSPAPRQSGQSGGLLLANDEPRRSSVPGTGELRAVIDDVEVRLPLERTDVEITVLGPVATGTVRQRFANPYTEPIEAVYVFPLPHDAAIHDFVLTIGERRIRGIVREREEARRIYEAARAQGHTAALLTQERPNVFVQNVANLVPGASIDVELAYLEAVDLVDGWQEIAFPMVVGPRYNPVGWERGIGATGRGGSTNQPTDVTYLRPHERSGHDISLTVELRAGLAVERISSPSHAVTVDERPDGAVVRLAAAQAIPNADFRLRWRVAGDGLRAGLIRQGDHALLTLYPPDDLTSLPRRPVEHVFVLDTSGSMRGEPLAVLKRAMRAALDQLEPDDTFHLLHFSDAIGALDERPLVANARNKRRARQWLDRLRAGGGTRMLEALQAALARESDGERTRVVTFFTDGYIGNETEILAAIQTREADARIFAFGIGSSPNRWLMAEMAARSGGAEAYVGLDEDPGPTVTAFFERASRPAVEGLRLTWSGAHATAAADLPKGLLCGRPLTMPFELRGADGEVSLLVEGRVNGAWREVASASSTDAADLDRDVLGKVWARRRLAQLATDARIAPTSERASFGDRMCALALEHGLVSSFTSFVAVDSAGPVTDGGQPARVDVAVPVPAGVEYETTVQR